MGIGVTAAREDPGLGPRRRPRPRGAGRSPPGPPRRPCRGSAGTGHARSRSPSRARRRGSGSRCAVPRAGTPAAGRARGPTSAARSSRGDPRDRRTRPRSRPPRSWARRAAAWIAAEPPTDSPSTPTSRRGAPTHAHRVVHRRADVLRELEHRPVPVLVGRAVVARVEREEIEALLGAASRSTAASARRSGPSRARGRGTARPPRADGIHHPWSVFPPAVGMRTVSNASPRRAGSRRCGTRGFRQPHFTASTTAAWYSDRDTDDHEQRSSRDEQRRAPRGMRNPRLSSDNPMRGA